MKIKYRVQVNQYKGYSKLFVLIFIELLVSSSEINCTLSKEVRRAALTVLYEHSTRTQHEMAFGLRIRTDKFKNIFRQGINYY